MRKEFVQLSEKKYCRIINWIEIYFCGFYCISTIITRQCRDLKNRGILALTGFLASVLSELFTISFISHRSVSTDSFNFLINSSISDVLAIASGPSGSSVEFVEHELAVAAC